MADTRQMAESAEDMFNYMNRKIDRGTTWEQLGEKLTERGVMIRHDEVVFLGAFLKESGEKFVGTDEYEEFGTYLKSLFHFFGTLQEIKEKLLLKCGRMALRAEKDEQFDNIKGIKEQVEIFFDLMRKADEVEAGFEGK